MRRSPTGGSASSPALLPGNSSGSNHGSPQGSQPPRTPNFSQRPATPTNGMNRPNTPSGVAGGLMFRSPSGQTPDLAMQMGQNGGGVGLMGGLASDGRVRRNSLSKSLGLIPDEAPLPTRLTAEEMKERIKKGTKMMDDGMENEDADSLLQGLILARSCSGMDRAYMDNATKFLQQLEAKDALEYATKMSDVPALKRCVANAKQAGLEGLSVQQGEVKLEKLCAQESLMNAMGSPESGALRIAIRRAQLAGLSEELGELADTLAEAEKTLEQLEAQRMLTLALQRPPPGKEPDKYKIQDAVDKATAVGIKSSELDQANFLLTELGGRVAPKVSFAPLSKIQECQEQLIRAINLYETGGLKDAIKRAMNNSVDVPELDMAKQLLAQMEAMRLLDAAVKGKTHDVKKLKAAVEACQASQIPEHECAQAMSLIEGMQAHAALCLAITSKDPDTIGQAIGRATAAGCDRSKIVKAEETLKQIAAKEADMAAKNAAAAERAALGDTAGKSPARGRRILTAGSQIAGEASQGRNAIPPGMKRAPIIAIGSS